MGKIKNWRKNDLKTVTIWYNKKTHYTVRVDKLKNSVEILCREEPEKDEYWYFKSYTAAYNYAIKRIKKRTG